MTAAERTAMINQIRMLPTKLEDAVRRLNDAQLDTPYGEGKWTLRQVVHHLADSHINALSRFKLVLTEDNPIIKPYRQEQWATLPDSLKQPLEPSLQILRGLHYRWSALLENVPESAWQRTGFTLQTEKLRSQIC